MGLHKHQSLRASAKNSWEVVTRITKWSITTRRGHGGKRLPETLRNISELFIYDILPMPDKTQRLKIMLLTSTNAVQYHSASPLELKKFWATVYAPVEL
jgi:hypothetical protein